MRDVFVYWLILLCYLYITMKYSGMILQQNHYHIDRYLTWLKKNWLSKKTILISMLLCCLSICYLLPLSYQKEVILLSMAIIAYLTFKLDHEIKYRVPLKFTHRMKRLWMVRVCFYLVTTWLMCLCNACVWIFVTPWLFWLPFLEIISSVVLIKPLEQQIQNHYAKEAKAMLTNHQSLRIIGITGSYGKTSVKHILYTLLSDEYETLMTPKSFNNKMGITLTIRNSLKRLHEVFLCEMGADHVGEILELMKFVRPQIGIVTAIGPQHLSTFHSMEHIIREKMYMVEKLPATGLGFLNADNVYIRSHPLANACPIIWFGKDVIADYRIMKIQPHGKGTTFSIQYKNECIPFHTCLLGEHNVTNICASIAVAHELGCSFPYLQEHVQRIPYIKHRLEIVSTSPYTLIDDAYNANPLGAHYALQVLAGMKEKTIIVTPGMIELGKQQDQANKAFGKEMARCVDEVILVGIKQSQKIKEGLQEEHYEESRIHVCKDFASAMQVLKSIVCAGDVVLLENDLPDAFLH